MSMAMALEGVRDYLRSQYSPPFDEKHCGIHVDGIPPATARGYYLALDEGGVTGTFSNNSYLSEEYSISVYLCRNVNDKPKDRQGQQLLRDDPYLATLYSLEKIEREVIIALHQRQQARNAINKQFMLPDAMLGDVFLLPLVYEGRGRTDAVTAQDSNEVYHRRELRFRGLKRNQNLNCAG